MKKATIVLAGNPNCGKTALFNALTGSRQRIGNWPGVTVERKQGVFKEDGFEVTVVDLPGTYSLNVPSLESAVDEQIASEYLLSQEAELIVNVVDASNLIRHLYLSLQILEMQKPMIIAVNMMDVAHRRGLELNLNLLSEILRCPVVPLVVTKGLGLSNLKESIINQLKYPTPTHWSMPMKESLHQAVELLKIELETSGYQPSEWLALRLLENDVLVSEKVSDSIKALAQQQMDLIEKNMDEESDILIADARYTFINQVLEQVVTQRSEKRRSMTQHIDKIILNRILGIPIFLLVMYSMFFFSIKMGGIFQDFFDLGSEAIFVKGLGHVLAHWHFSDWFVALASEGVGRGINTVVSFIPVIGSMFLFLAFLEDSGYMARAAFVMDRLMQTVGLPGRAFVPMIIGFGCNVPAVMAARTLGSARDRVLTVMMMPFMSCGARLAIFAVFASAFFHNGGQNIIFFLYLIGIVVAILTGLVLRKTVLSGEPATLIMELPSYHWPKFSSICKHAWHRLNSFLTRATQVIIPVCILIGLLNSITVEGKWVERDSTHPTYLAKLGQSLTPLFKPMGLRDDNWPATVGLITGVLAKEVVIGTLNTLYSQMDDLGEKMRPKLDWRKDFSEAFYSIPQNFRSLGSSLRNPIQAAADSQGVDHTVYGLMVGKFDGRVGAFAYLLLVLLYFPCVSTVAAMRKEVGNGWAAFSMCWSTGLAYALSVMVYQALRFFVHPYSSTLWILLMTLVLSGVILFLKNYATRSSD